MQICYINFSLRNPRDTITIRGLRENGVSVITFADDTPGYRKYLRIARACLREAAAADAVIVGYAGGLLVPLARLCTRKRVIYNTLSTFFDSMIVARFGGAWFSLRALRVYLIDFVAFRLADHVCIECEGQRQLAMQRYGVRPDRISVHYVGADDALFHPDSSVPKADTFTVLFRGMFLPESGADLVVRAAKALEGENIHFRIIGRGLELPKIERLVAELTPTNIELITKRLPDDELRRQMLECHLSLGQLADHPRVHTTVPHKAFESMAMRLPYLTGANRGVLEILKDGETCFTVPPGDHHALAQKILMLRDRPEDLMRVAENACNLYRHAFSPAILGQTLNIDLLHAST